MVIHERQPSVETLVKFAFNECPQVGHVRICQHDGEFTDYAYRQMRGVVQPPDNERNSVMSFTTDYLWKLMQARQIAWQKENPHAEVTFA